MVDVTHGFRLSLQQKNLWLALDDHAAYRAECMLTIEGDLNRALLKEAVQHVIQRHEGLRTTFRRKPGMRIPLQVIVEQSTLDWQEIDLRSERGEQIESNIVDLLATRSSALNVEQGSLVLGTLLLLEDQQRLHLSMSALSADARSLEQMVQEIAQAYAARLGLHELPAEEERVQYLQFSEWQNELLEQEDEQAESGTRYWQAHHFSTAPALSLPFEHQASQPARFAPARLRASLDSALVGRLAALAEQRDTTIATLLFAAWQALLLRVTGQTESVLGYASAGREYDELQDVIGLFAKWLPIHSQIDPAAPFSSVLDQSDAAVQEAYDWQEYFIRLREDQAGSSAAPPIIGFEFRKRPSSYAAGTISLTITSDYVYFDGFKLKLVCIQTDDALDLELHYNANLLPEEAVAHLPGQLQALLTDVAHHPEAAVRDLNLVSEAERQHLLATLNGTPMSFAAPGAVHLLIEEQAARTPERLAVVFEEQSLTYAELNARANQLARYLQKRGAGPGSLVGVCVDRSIEMIVGLLGVLKAGSAYVPLDPDLPAQRMRLMLEDIQAPVIVTQQRSQPLPDVPGATVCLSSDWSMIAQESAANPVDRTQPQDLAYVLFTSGSTGRPKGVCVEHRQLLNYILSIGAQLDLPEAGSFALVSTFAADLGNTMLFPALCTGGTLHVISARRATDPDGLAAYFQQHAIDCLKIVPSHLRALLSAAQPQHVIPRQRLILGGEATPWELVERIHELAPDCVLVNHYGPTEATVGVLTYQVNFADPRLSRMLPLAGPIANTQAYLLDQNLQPVPVGVAGEIYLGGAGLARGYLNRPDATARQFLPHPFSDQPGARLYKTGDRARFLPDYRIEFLGRADDQIKFHGYRVQLDEIRYALNRYPEIEDSLVVLRNDNAQNETLVGYYVARQTIAPAQLRAFLAQSIIEETLPNIFVRIDAIPLTLNGKIDYQSLPAVDEARDRKRQPYVAPRTPAETTLTRIWAEVLGTERIGVHDNFFDLGGDSILGIQIIARCNQLGMSLVAKDLFQYQTVAELAPIARSEPNVQFDQGLVTGSSALLPIQHWFFEQQIPDPNHWGITVLLEAQQELNPELVEQALQLLLTHHDALRLRFVHGPDGWQATIAEPDATPRLVHVDLSATNAAELESRIEALVEQLQSSLNLADGPLLKAALVKAGPAAPAQVLVTIHRLVVDGVSWRTLLDHFYTAYEQLQRGEPVQLPPKTTSYKAWAERLAAYAQAEALEQELAYWTAEPPNPIAAIPIDFPDAGSGMALDQRVMLQLSVEETQALLHDASQAYRAEINDLLLTALAQTLAGAAEATTLLVDLEAHGREDLFPNVDLSRTVGWFTANYPVMLNLNLNQGQTPGDSVRAVKDQLGRIPNHGIGYGILRYLSPDPSIRERLRSRPQADVVFRYTGQFHNLSRPLFAARQQWEPNGPTRRHRLAVIASISEDRLGVSWSYSRHAHRPATIEQLAQQFMDSLRSLISQAQVAETSSYSVADFPLVDLEQDQLDEILKKLNQ